MPEVEIGDSLLNITKCIPIHGSWARGWNLQGFPYGFKSIPLKSCLCLLRRLRAKTSTSRAPCCVCKGSRNTCLSSTAVPDIKNLNLKNRTSPNISSNGMRKYFYWTFVVPERCNGKRKAFAIDRKEFIVPWTVPGILIR